MTWAGPVVRTQENPNRSTDAPSQSPTSQIERQWIINLARRWERALKNVCRAGRRNLSHIRAIEQLDIGIDIIHYPYGMVIYSLLLQIDVRERSRSFTQGTFPNQ